MTEQSTSDRLNRASNDIFEATSFLNGTNAAFVEQMYAAWLARGEEPVAAPRETALGSLVHYITHADAKHFQPANITFDLLEPLDEQTRRKIRDKRERHRLQCERALAAFDAWWSEQAAAVAI